MRGFEGQIVEENEDPAICGVIVGERRDEERKDRNEVEYQGDNGGGFGHRHFRESGEVYKWVRSSLVQHRRRVNPHNQEFRVFSFFFLFNVLLTFLFVIMKLGPLHIFINFIFVQQFINYIRSKSKLCWTNLMCSSRLEKQ